MSHVHFKKWQCRMSLSLIFPNVTCQISEKAMSHVITMFSPCRMSLGLMLHVEFRKCPCRRVYFRGLGQSSYSSQEVWCDSVHTLTWCAGVCHRWFNGRGYVFVMINDTHHLRGLLASVTLQGLLCLEKKTIFHMTNDTDRHGLWGKMVVSVIM